MSMIVDVVVEAYYRRQLQFRKVSSWTLVGWVSHCWLLWLTDQKSSTITDNVTSLWKHPLRCNRCCSNSEKFA